MTRRSSRPAGRATDHEVGAVAAVLAAGSEKAAAHRLGLSHSTVKHHLASARSKVGADDDGAARGSSPHACPNLRAAAEPEDQPRSLVHALGPATG